MLGLADHGGVEGFAGQVAAEESELADLDAGGVGAGPAVISTVAGSNGTLVLAEPRVAITAHAGRRWLVASVYRPAEERNELVSGDPRAGSPLAVTTAIVALAADGQITARWNGMPPLSPPAMFLVLAAADDPTETEAAAGRLLAYYPAHRRWLTRRLRPPSPRPTAGPPTRSGHDRAGRRLARPVRLATVLAVMTAGHNLSHRTLSGRCRRG